MISFMSDMTMLNFKTFSVILALSSAFYIADANTVALVIGGYGGGNSVEVITEKGACLGTESKPHIPNAPVGTLAGWFAEYSDGLLYLCGGQDTEVHNECYTLRIGSNSWTKTCGMNAERRYAASVAMPDGTIVVLGGYNKKNGWLDLVEVKPAGQCEFAVKDAWTLPQKKFDLCAVALNDTHIMIAGGSLKNQPQTDAVDILDTTTGTWTSAAPLPSPRSAPGCILTNINGEEGVLVTGGFNSDALVHYADSQFYSLAKGTWTKLDDMNNKRMGHGVYHVGDDRSIYVIGGYEQNLLSGIESYTPASGWSNFGSSLTFPRYQFGGTEIPDTLLSC